MMCKPRVVRCCCLDSHLPMFSQESELNIVCVFGNNLCMIISVTEDLTVKELLSLGTTDFICGACVYEIVSFHLVDPIFQNSNSFLFTVSINGFSKIYSLSKPNFQSAQLLQNICTTNFSILYCTCFVDCLCKHNQTPLCIGGTSNLIFVWSFKTKPPENKVVLSHFGCQKVRLLLMYSKITRESFLQWTYLNLPPVHAIWHQQQKIDLLSYGAQKLANFAQNLYYNLKTGVFSTASMLMHPLPIQLYLNHEFGVFK